MVFSTLHTFINPPDPKQAFEQLPPSTREKLERFVIKHRISDVLREKILKMLGATPEAVEYLCNTFVFVGGARASPGAPSTSTTSSTVLGGEQGKIEENNKDKELHTQIHRHVDLIFESKPYRQVSRIKNNQIIELKVDSNGACIGSVLEVLSGKTGIAYSHCQITGRRTDTPTEPGMAYYVRDMNTTTGTVVDGDRIPSAEPGVRLYDGCMLKIGECSFAVEQIYVVEDVNSVVSQQKSAERRERDVAEYEAQKKRRSGAPRAGGGVPGMPLLNSTNSDGAGVGLNNLRSSPRDDDFLFSGGQRTSPSDGDGSEYAYVDRARKRRKVEEKFAPGINDIAREKNLKTLQKREMAQIEEDKEKEKRSNLDLWGMEVGRAEAGLNEGGEFGGLRSESGRAGVGAAEEIAEAVSQNGAAGVDMRMATRMGQAGGSVGVGASSGAGGGGEEGGTATGGLAALFKKSGAQVGASAQENGEVKIKITGVEEGDSSDEEEIFNPFFGGAGLGAR